MFSDQQKTVLTTINAVVSKLIALKIYLFSIVNTLHRGIPRNRVTLIAEVTLIAPMCQSFATSVFCTFVYNTHVNQAFDFI